MAIWQCDLQLMPNAVVPDAPSCIDAAITDDGLDTTDWWLPNQPPNDYAQIIANVFPPLDSWSREILRWGDEDNVLIEAFITNGHVDGIGVRVDVRNADRDSMTKMAGLAARLDCHVYMMETHQIVTPDLDSLLPHLAKSKAAQFARDPKGFIERLAREDAK